jgi:hypothetical protein
MQNRFEESYSEQIAEIDQLRQSKLIGFEKKIQDSKQADYNGIFGISSKDI